MTLIALLDAVLNVDENRVLFDFSACRDRGNCREIGRVPGLLGLHLLDVAIEALLRDLLVEGCLEQELESLVDHSLCSDHLDEVQLGLQSFKCPLMHESSA